jgi:hypothetical protein
MKRVPTGDYETEARFPFCGSVKQCELYVAPWPLFAFCIMLLWKVLRNYVGLARETRTANEPTPTDAPPHPTPTSPIPTPPTPALSHCVVCGGAHGGRGLFLNGPALCHLQAQFFNFRLRLCHHN